MVKSIQFTGESGYIVNKIPEPNCRVRGYDPETKSVPFHKITEEEAKRIKEWEQEHEEWEKHKDDFLHPQLVDNLIGRKFEFKDGINLIFGPNASGKTTILKAIAGAGGTTDGYATLGSPLDIRDYGLDRDGCTSDTMKRYISNLMKNSADIDWDGAPIYYDNFCNRQSYGSIGDLCGSVLGNSICDEILYTMSKNKISMGQNSIYLLSRLMDIAKEHLSYADIFSKYVNQDGTYKKDFGVNDVWEKAYKVQMDYYLGFEKSLVKSPSTFLFDELDKSLDIGNIYMLYTEILPQLVKDTGIQIIIISHSPLVLSEKIRNHEMYNFISIDEKYTKDCIDNIGKLF